MFDGQWLARRPVQRSQRLADDRIAHSREPAGLGRRKALEVLADRLDEHQLRQASHHVLATWTSAPRFPHCKAQQRAEPSGRDMRTAGGQVNDGGERGKQRIVRALVTAEEAAGDPRALGAATSELVDHWQRRGGSGEGRHAGRRPHPRRAGDHVGVTARKDDEIAFAQGCGLLADGRVPSRCPGRSGDTRLSAPWVLEASDRTSVEVTWRRPATQNGRSRRVFAPTRPYADGRAGESCAGGASKRVSLCRVLRRPNNPFQSEVTT
jgi:hypothetical protein